MRRPSSLCLVFESNQFCPAVPLQTFRQLVQLQHEVHPELLAHALELLFRSLLGGYSKRVHYAPASENVALSEM